MKTATTGREGLTSARIDDTRIVSIQEIPPPEQLRAELPNDAVDLVCGTRQAIMDIIAGVDDRLLVVVGPCSVHDPDAALEYAGRLRACAARLDEDLLIVMRVYFEKPRTSVGWKGLINDPGLDGSHDVERGLRVARDLLRGINALGLPCGTEFLDTVIPQYISDQVSWGAIGARTTESQVHRQLASGLSCPVGFKNGTDGNVNVAAAAILAARKSHHFLAVTGAGKCALAETAGNADTHVILRGGTNGPNYDAAHVAAAAGILAASDLPERLMVDCSHANSNKEHRVQIQVATAVGDQVAGGDRRIIGVMVESNLVEGTQDVRSPDLVRGQSVTDACLGWEDTEALLDRLAHSTRARRVA